VRRALYDLMYRIGAPWDGPPRPELVTLVERGVLTPAQLAPGRAVDLGCGTGATVIYLAQHGFDSTGIDFSAIALRTARKRASAVGMDRQIRFVEGDLTASEIPSVEGPFDLLVDYGTLDDLDPAGRRAMATLISNLARPGALFLLWCFWARRSELPRVSLSGPSRMIPVIEPGEETTLFGDDFSIERLASPEPSTHTACFLMTRR
jgi:cyclopropane fatty-acyl-phospholipid synthase-like methyltransferase